MSITDTGKITVQNLDDKYDEAYRRMHHAKFIMDALSDDFDKAEKDYDDARKEFKELEQLKQDQDDRDERNLP